MCSINEWTSLLMSTTTVKIFRGCCSACLGRVVVVRQQISDSANNQVAVASNFLNKLLFRVQLTTGH